MISKQCNLVNSAIALKCRKFTQPAHTLCGFLHLAIQNLWPQSFSGSPHTADQCRGIPLFSGRGDRLARPLPEDQWLQLVGKDSPKVIKLTLIVTYTTREPIRCKNLALSYILTTFYIKLKALYTALSDPLPTAFAPNLFCLLTVILEKEEVDHFYIFIIAQ